MKRFADKIVLITGGSTGIGQATALAFAHEGASVVIAGRRADEGEKTIALLKAQGAEARFIQTDVTVEADVARLLEEVVSHYKRLDIAFNNAGYEGIQNTVSELSEADWDTMLDVNLKGIWLSIKHELQQMRVQESGIIVNMSTCLAYIGMPQMGAYSAAKAGVLALTRVAALEYIKSGIRINAVSPGVVGTPMTERLFGSPEDRQQRVGQFLPVGRFGVPEEIASAVLWLSSSESSYVVGQDIILDGGASIQ